MRATGAGSLREPWINIWRKQFSVVMNIPQTIASNRAKHGSCLSSSLREKILVPESREREIIGDGVTNLVRS